MLQPKLFVIQALITNEKAALGTAANDARSVSPSKSTTSLHIGELLQLPLEEIYMVAVNVNTVRVPDVKDCYSVSISFTAEHEHPRGHIHMTSTLNIQQGGDTVPKNHLKEPRLHELYL